MPPAAADCAVSAALGVLLVALGAGCSCGHASAAPPPPSSAPAQAASAVAPPRSCRGFAHAAGADDEGALRAYVGACDPNTTEGPELPLEAAVTRGKVLATRLLLEAGADPNAPSLLGDHVPVSTRLGAARRASSASPSDEDLLAVATLLAEHRCTFGVGVPTRIDVVANLASRRVPKTLAFLVAHGAGADRSAALKAIARQDDTASVEALLAGGADPLLGPALSSALLDATSAGRAASVAAMLAKVADKNDPKVAAAYKAAKKRGDADVVGAFVAAGVHDEPESAAPRPPVAVDLPPPLARLATQLGIDAPRCKLRGECGAVAFIDCDSAADGPAYYVDRAQSRILATCGGACMRGCTNCPPKEWTCP